MLRAMCGIQPKDIKRSINLMLMLGLNEIIDQMVMANSVCWHGNVLRREDGHILSRAFDLEIEGQRKKWRSKRTWKKQVEKKV